MKSINLILIMILFISCKSYKSLELVEKNPTQYIFDVEFNKVKKIVINDMNNYKGMKVKTSSNDTIFCKLNDIQINDSNILLVNENYCISSSLYYKHGTKLIYYVSFLIQLKVIDETKTMVIINTINPNVLVGRELLPSLPHMVRLLKVKKVPISTIEEYEILLELGKYLGVNNMKKINYPKNYSTLKEPKMPWE